MLLRRLNIKVIPMSSSATRCFRIATSVKTVERPSDWVATNTYQQIPATTTNISVNEKLSNAYKRSDDRFEYVQHRANKQIIKNESELPPGWADAKPFSAVPGPKALPIVGNLWRYMPPAGKYYGLNIFQLHSKLCEEYGDIVSMNGMIFGRDMVVLFNPSDMEYCLMKEVDYYNLNPPTSGVTKQLKYKLCFA